jgi:YVTN family beta-propeller protein
MLNVQRSPPPLLLDSLSIPGMVARFLMKFRFLAAALVSFALPLHAQTDPTRGPVESPDKSPQIAPATPGAEGDLDWSMMKVHDKDHPGLAETGHQIKPAGLSIRVSGRIMSMALARGGKFLVVKSNTHLSVVDTETFHAIEQVPFPNNDEGKADRGSMHGIAVSPDGTRILFSGNLRLLHPATLDEAGHLTFEKPISLGPNSKTANPLGVAFTPDGKRAIVALSVANEVVVVDLATREVTQRIPVGVCPYAVLLSRDGKTAFVSNFGGRRAKENDKTEIAAGTAVAVDERSVALRGSVSVINLKAGEVIETITTGIHPEEMTFSQNGKQLLVVDESGDSVSVIDIATRKVVGKLGVKPEPTLPYGSLANGIAVNETAVFTVNAGNNAVAMIDPAKPEKPFAFLAAGGYPGAICVQGRNVFVGNIYGYQGNLQKITLPSDPAELAKMSDEARRGFRFSEIVRSQIKAMSGAAPKAIPERVGEPSPIKHVVYIIKENKKYDPVLGDIGRGNSDPKLCEFPRATTPNTHALVDEFVLLDNYYCSGVLSSVGHQWTVQGLTTPYREKDWSNARSPYDFGNDPLSYAGCGFIWDHLLRKGISFRNFGELGNLKKPVKPLWQDFYHPWSEKRPGPEFVYEYKLESLRNYSDLRYPGWEMAIPDQLRADAFLKALAEFEKAGTMPEFTIVYLPNDHTNHAKKGWPTPRAYVADNDLALGRVVEGLSKSPFWKDMAIFSIQDDPQTGADHVDGHRSFCLIASPYAKRGGPVISRFYNQSSVLHTICRIFGVPPMNQLVALSPLMSECFQEVPDFTPFTCRTSDVALGETNPDPKDAPTKAQSRLAPKTYDLDFSAPDRIDDDALVFSAWVWSTTHGDEPFPAAYFGPHGKGLKALGLKLDPNGVGDDDD